MCLHTWRGSKQRLSKGRGRRQKRGAEHAGACRRRGVHRRRRRHCCFCCFFGPSFDGADHGAYVAVLGEAALGARVPGGREGLRQVGFIKLELLSQRGCAIKTYEGTQGVNGEGGAACMSCAHDSQDVTGADSAAGAAADPSMLRLTFFEFTIAKWPCCDKERFFLTLPFFFGGMALLQHRKSRTTFWVFRVFLNRVTSVLKSERRIPG